MSCGKEKRKRKRKEKKKEPPPPPSSPNKITSHSSFSSQNKLRGPQSLLWNMSFHRFPSSCFSGYLDPHVSRSLFYLHAGLLPWQKKKNKKKKVTWLFLSFFFLSSVSFPLSSSSLPLFHSFSTDPCFFSPHSTNFLFFFFLRIGFIPQPLSLSRKIR